MKKRLLAATSVYNISCGMEQRNAVRNGGYWVKEEMGCKFRKEKTIISPFLFFSNQNLILHYAEKLCHAQKNFVNLSPIL